MTLPPFALRQNEQTPFRFRGLRKRRENAICVGAFFLSDLKPALQIGWETNLSVTASPCQLPLGRGALGVLTQWRALHVRVLEQAKQKEDERCSPLRIGKSEESKVKKQGTSQSFALQKTAPLEKGSS